MSIEAADTVLVAGGDDLIGRPIDPALVAAVAALLAGRDARRPSAPGPSSLAQAGTTGRTSGHHALAARRAIGAGLSRDVTVEPDAIFVRDGEVFTSAGVSAGIDLALALVELDHGSDLVREVARSLVVYLKRAGGQSQFSVLVEADAPQRSPLRPLTDAIAADPGADHSVNALARRASMSPRQLTRVFHIELGTTPARYVEMVRVDAARAALMLAARWPRRAHLVGFGSAETLRRVFVSHLGVSPRAYRDRFRTTSGE